MKRIAIIGSSELGRQIAHHARCNGYVVSGFFDDFQKDETVDGIPVFGTCDSVCSSYNQSLFDELICAIGYNHFDFRQYIYERFMQEKIPFATLVDKSCHIDSTAQIGNGSVLYPGVFIDKGVKIGDNVLVNLCSTISHDSSIGSHTFIAPRVAIAGFTQIGKRCMLGINSTVIDNVCVADDVRLGGGGLIINNLDKSGLYVGVPARLIR